MPKKFDEKKFKGKRTSSTVKGYQGISRIWVWNSQLKKYCEPNRGKKYCASRYEVLLNGFRKRVKQYFHSLDEARDWQSGLDIIDETPEAEGPLFDDALAVWEKRIYPSLKKGTQVRCERVVRLHFPYLMGIELSRVNSKFVDSWIDWMKENLEKAPEPRRRSFEQELKLLSTVFNAFIEYEDDLPFVHPIKKRHKKAVQLNLEEKERLLDLKIEEFFRFRDSIALRDKGDLLSVLVTVQYFQAWRISEAVALHWDDITLDELHPERSVIRKRRSVKWSKQKGAKPTVELGYKNSKSKTDYLEQPIFPEVYSKLLELKKSGNAEGYLFFDSIDNIPTYRKIQYTYDQGFKKAGLPYRGTHVMRHGGCRHLYNQYPDLALAKQHLGNSSIDATLVYAKRDQNALNDAVKKQWQDHPTK